ncbi:MAG: adenylyltransferase/cytidyltransferase family protein [Candidatus Woesearchaeota archaeon]
MKITSPKVKTREEIRQIADELRNHGKTIVSINGSYDILHIGHIKMLQEARKQGDVLILGLNSDESVREWKKFVKNPNWYKRPINPAWARAEMLAALDSVDYIEIYDEPECMPFLDNLKPHIHVNGSDYGEDCVEAPTVKKNGGRIYIAKFIEGFSTTKFIEKILDIYNDESEKR